MVKECNDNIPIDLKSSFFVGDDAGTVGCKCLMSSGRPKDDSDSDKKFAEAVGIQFYNEVQYFKQMP